MSIQELALSTAKELSKQHDDILMKALSLHLGTDADKQFFIDNSHHLSCSEMDGTRSFMCKGRVFLELSKAIVTPRAFELSDPTAVYAASVGFQYRFMNEAVK